MTPEEKVQKLIALKRYEQPPEGYYDDFLQEFQQRQREELLQKSSVSLLLERIGIWFRELGFSKWLLAGGLAYAALTVAFLVWQNRPVSESAPSQLTPAFYQGQSLHQGQPIPEVDFENGKRYQTPDSRRKVRHDFLISL